MSCSECLYLLGTAATIRERLRLYRDAGVTTLRAQLQGEPTTDIERQIGDLARLLELVADVNGEATHDPSGHRRSEMSQQLEQREHP